MGVPRLKNIPDADLEYRKMTEPINEYWRCVNCGASQWEDGKCTFCGSEKS